MTADRPVRAASQVLLIEPAGFRFNPETRESNVFQESVSPAEERELAELAGVQHARLRELLVAHGVLVTLTRSLDTTPDGPFCNNWFSTHRSAPGDPGTLILYPLLAANRRPERRNDLVEWLRARYRQVLDLSERERAGRFLESTGSLVIDHRNRVAYAAISPRTDPDLAAEWSRDTGYDLLTFSATDAAGVPYYHTNVVMFIGHGLAGLCLQSIDPPDAGDRVRDRLRADDNTLLELARDQVGEYCGNCLALESGDGTPLFVMSSRAWRGFRPEQRTLLERHGRILHTDLSAFEKLGGGSARCLIGELF